ELEGLGLTVEIDYSDGTSGPLQIDDDDDGPRRPSDIDNISARDLMGDSYRDDSDGPAKEAAEDAGVECSEDVFPEEMTEVLVPEEADGMTSSEDEGQELDEQ
ncbi:MAG: hypothetical protein II965_09440, partial [Pyramidobacter sp.]|nr:hypothetical protein [Pyramidobacter sp.]